ncbi:MAG TPA: MBL fold metallo-hydrolase [Thermoanaerobacterales bacterium]|jgi:7,8-dihydropterin-6-yl-methyl-4-(beta-D-ribofuranosyl)aminobenzene 5'-phosphate synthase|nr:MBL fold metallo-hydrolase [Thermoanaerobacterales bacterium]
MKFKATILCENCVLGNEGAVAEHGWSIFIETNQGNFLFDTGQGKSIINNAQFFKTDLSTTKAIMLSHHHSDHTGGLLDVLSVTGPVDVIAHPELFKESFHIQEKQKTRYIGIPFRRSVLESKGARFKFNTTWQEIVPELSLTGEIPRITDFEKGDKDLVIRKGTQFEQDLIMDDQSLVLETKRGLYIILGCAHSGIINILEYAIKKTGQDHICAIIGGTHLGLVGKEQQQKSIEALKKYDIDYIGVSHCTGLKTSMVLAQEFGEKFFFCNVGTVIEA